MKIILQGTNSSHSAIFSREVEEFKVSKRKEMSQFSRGSVMCLLNCARYIMLTYDNCCATKYPSQQDMFTRYTWRKIDLQIISINLIVLRNIFILNLSHVFRISSSILLFSCAIQETVNYTK